MSTNTFDITKYYQKRLPRGLYLKNQWIYWFDTASFNAGGLSIVPASAPEPYTQWIEELWFDDQTLLLTQTQDGDGMIVITYPNADGDGVETITIDYMADLDKLCHKEVTINSIKYKVMVFDPPVMMFDSKTYKTFSVLAHSNATAYLSGNLTIIAKKIWTIKETDY